MKRAKVGLASLCGGCLKKFRGGGALCPECVKGLEKPIKRPCRLCDREEPRITAHCCYLCKAPICREHTDDGHCEDCYP